MAADRRPLLALVAALAVAVAGCGNDSAGDRSSVAVRPLSAQNPISLVPHATPAEYRRPIARYRRYVAGRLVEVARDVRALRGAVDRGDLAGARRAWRAANAGYQTIGAAYGAFGSLDAAIDTTADGLPGGVHDRDFTGLHRVELALYGRRSVADARRPAAALVQAVDRLRARIGSVEIDPLEYSLRVHEILEDTLDLQLTGQAAPWAGTAYDAVAANVTGTRAVLRTLQPMIDARARARRLRAEAALSAVSGALRAVRRDGAYPTLSTVGAADCRRIAALTAGAAEALSYLPEIIDPRPPRPVRSPYAERS